MMSNNNDLALSLVVNVHNLVRKVRRGQVSSKVCCCAEARALLPSPYRFPTTSRALTAAIFSVFLYQTLNSHTKSNHSPTSASSCRRPPFSNTCTQRNSFAARPGEQVMTQEYLYLLKVYTEQPFSSSSSSCLPEALVCQRTSVRRFSCSPPQQSRRCPTMLSMRGSSSTTRIRLSASPKSSTSLTRTRRGSLHTTPLRCQRKARTTSSIRVGSYISASVARRIGILIATSFVASAAWLLQPFGPNQSQSDMARSFPHLRIAVA
jgi:hypothetical protein